MVEKQSTNIAMLNKEYRTAKIELEQLRRSASENAARNPIISDEMQVCALSYKIKIKMFRACYNISAMQHKSLICCCGLGVPIRCEYSSRSLIGMVYME